MKYLRIGDFSNLVGISVKTIRFYEEKGLIKPAYIDEYTGYRYYDDGNIEQVLMILQYKNMGFTLAEIKNINPDLLISKVKSLKKQMFNVQKSIKNIELMIEKRECTELAFVNDEAVIGKWELLDDEAFPFKELYFLPNGKEYWVFSWTKGFLKILDVYHPYEIIDETLCLSVVDINGVIGKKVKFKRINNKKYTIDEIRQVDDVNYEFVNDEKILGIWRTIAFTHSNDYQEAIKDIHSDLFLQTLVFCKGGKLISERNDGTLLNHLLWTKGKVIDNKYSMTSSRYEIEKIDNIEYLIYEWKSGDYIFGKRKPGKYILIKD